MATLRDLLIRDKAKILEWKGYYGWFVYYVDEVLYPMNWATEETRALEATPEYQEIILGIVPDQKYGCVNNLCTPQTDGVYTESTCAGACKQTTPSNNTGIIIIAGLAGLALAFLKGRKK